MILLDLLMILFLLFLLLLKVDFQIGVEQFKKDVSDQLLAIKEFDFFENEGNIIHVSAVLKKLNKERTLKTYLDWVKWIIF